MEAGSTVVPKLSGVSFNADGIGGSFNADGVGGLSEDGSAADGVGRSSDGVGGLSEEGSAADGVGWLSEVGRSAATNLGGGSFTAGGVGGLSEDGSVAATELGGGSFDDGFLVPLLLNFILESKNHP